MWKNEKFTLTKNISSNHIIGIISLTIALFSRNFCYKSVSVNFRNSQCSVINLISRFCRKICKTSLISQIFGIFLYSSNLSFSKNWKVWYSWRRLGISSTEPRYFSQEIKKKSLKTIPMGVSLKITHLRSRVFSIGMCHYCPKSAKLFTLDHCSPFQIFSTPLFQDSPLVPIW